MHHINIQVYSPLNHHKSFHLCGLDSTDTSNASTSFTSRDINAIHHSSKNFMFLKIFWLVCDIIKFCH